MDTVIKMTTRHLLETVSKNRDKHKEIVHKAIDKYKELAIKEFEKHIKSIKSGKRVRRYLSLVEPKDHTKDYDLIISMLKVHTEGYIEISAREYKNYVLDEWDWTDNFVTTNSSYTEV